MLLVRTQLEPFQSVQYLSTHALLVVVENDVVALCPEDEISPGLVPGERPQIADDDDSSSALSDHRI